MHHAIPTTAGLVCSSQATARVPAQAVGCFKLQLSHALTLNAGVPGELRIAHGRVWVTLGNAADHTAARAGDYFLSAGEVLRLAGGQQVVIEAIDAQSRSSVSESAYFSWEPEAAMSHAVLPRPRQSGHIDVRQPLRDLGLAMHLAGNALGRLVQGLAAGLSGALVPRSIPASCTAQCSTIRH
jgi:hypothetical protein